MLERYRAKYSDAADAAAQTAAAPDFSGVSECQDDAAAAHQTVHSDLPERLVPSSLTSCASKLRPATLKKCETVRAFAIPFVKQEIAKGMPCSSITISKIAGAYAAATGAPATTAETLFKNEYLDIKAIFDAAWNDDDSLCHIGSGRLSYHSMWHT